MVFFKVIHRKKVGSSYVDRELDNVVEVSLKKGLGKKANTFQVDLSYEDKNISQDDFIVVYYSDGPIITLSDEKVIFFGQVKSYDWRIQNGTRVFSVKGYDYSYIVLQQAIPVSFKVSDGKTAPDIIKNLLESISFDEEGTGETKIKTDYMATVRSNGSPFPVKSYVSNYKKVIDAIAELSSPEYTGDTKTYLFYLDHNNQFHWFHPDDTSNINSFDIYPTTSGVISYSFEKSLEGIPSQIIVDCGRSLYSGSVSTYDVNPFITQPGTKVLAYREICRDLWDMEIREGNLIEDSSGQFINAYNSKKYKPNTYPITTTWGDVVNSDEEYHLSFNAEARERGKAKIKTIFRAFGTGIWKGKISFHYLVVSQGDIFKVHFPEVSPELSSKELRVDDITYVLGRNNVVEVSLKEDEKTIS